MIALVLHLTGALVLTAVGFGGGALMYLQKRTAWRQAHDFVRLLDYLLLAVRYRAIPCEDLLAMAAQNPAFTSLGLDGCRAFLEIPIPPPFVQALGRELQEGFADLENAPQSQACDTLTRMITLCRSTEQEKRNTATQARALYPKLGACLGLMAAILFS